MINLHGVPSFQFSTSYEDNLPQPAFFPLADNWGALSSLWAYKSREKGRLKWWFLPSSMMTVSQIRRDDIEVVQHFNTGMDLKRRWTIPAPYMKATGALCGSYILHYPRTYIQSLENFCLAVISKKSLCHHDYREMGVVVLDVIYSEWA